MNDLLRTRLECIPDEDLEKLLELYDCIAQAVNKNAREPLYAWWVAIGDKFDLFDDIDLPDTAPEWAKGLQRQLDDRESQVQPRNRAERRAMRQGRRQRP